MIVSHGILEWIPNPALYRASLELSPCRTHLVLISKEYCSLSDIMSCPLDTPYIQHSTSRNAVGCGVGSAVMVVSMSLD